MNTTDALSFLTHATSERIASARAAGHPLTADLLQLNLTEASRVLTAALAAPTDASPVS